MGKILVIEDDDLMRDMLREMLRRSGHEVTVAADGVEGLTLLEEGTFELVVTDIVMPEKEGLETILAIRRTMDIPIIAISGGGRNLPMNYLKAAAKFGANYAFTKPIDRKAFLAAVDETLSFKGA